MGWSTGSGLFAEIAAVIAETVTDEDDRKTIYESMIEAFTERDCDALDECFGIDYILDEALTEALDIDPPDSDEDEGDEWPDGGREDFS